MYNNVRDSWTAYKNLLNTAEEMLQMKRKEFQEIALRDQENIEHDFRKFEQIWDEYKKTASLDLRLDSAGLFSPHTETIFYRLLNLTFENNFSFFHGDDYYYLLTNLISSHIKIKILKRLIKIIFCTPFQSIKMKLHCRCIKLHKYLGRETYSNFG